MSLHSEGIYLLLLLLFLWESGSIREERNRNGKRVETRAKAKASLSWCVEGRGLRYVKRPDLDDRQIIIKKNHLNSTGIFLFVW